MTENSDFFALGESRIVIMSAPNGARRMPEQHSGVPITAAELAECAADLLEQSVSVLHMHVRDSAMQHSLDPALYREAIKCVRDVVGDDLIIQVTTEAVGRFGREEQMASVEDVRPEAVSLALRELCPDQASEIEAGRFFEWLIRERIWPQYILYSADEVQRFESLRRRGFFGEDNPFVMLVLGQYASGKEGAPGDLDQMLRSIPQVDFPWSVCCFGPAENAAALHAEQLGGHVRIGFENNVCLEDGREAPDNAALIAQFHESRAGSGRSVATARQIRDCWLS